MHVWHQLVYVKRLSIFLLNSSLIDHYNEILITAMDKYSIFLLKRFCNDPTIDVLNAYIGCTVHIFFMYGNNWFVLNMFVLKLCNNAEKTPFIDHLIEIRITRIQL